MARARVRQRSTSWVFLAAIVAVVVVMSRAERADRPIATSAT